VKSLELGRRERVQELFKLQRHWFFHTGQWALCAEAGKAKDGRWRVRIYFAPHGKKLPEDAVAFSSIDEVKTFVSDYFASSVVTVKPSGFPKPENL
jgi:hypothetical protein